LILPAGANGMQVRLGLLSVDFEDGNFSFHTSPPVFLNVSFVGSNFTLVADPLPIDGGIRIAIVQVRFYQELHGEKYFLQELGMQGLEIVGVS
jgi:hypothetical protein